MRKNTEKNRPRATPTMRWMDRYMGIPLTGGLGVLHRKRKLPAYRSIGLIKTACLGDTVLLSGVVADLRAALPDVRLILLCGPSNRGIAEYVEGLDEVVELSISRPWRAAAQIRRLGLDVLLDFETWARISALLCRLGGAKWTAGYKTAGQGRHWGYDAVVEHGRDCHELENYRRLAGLLGVKGEHLPRLTVPDGPMPEEVAERDRVVVMHAWSGGSQALLKQWPKERWIALAREVAEMGYQAVFTGGSEDRAATAEITAGLSDLGDRVVNLAGHLTLEQTMRLLQAAACLVTVNTGPAHMGAAVGCRVVCLDGVTPARRWGPVGECAVSIEPADGPGGFIHLGFEKAPAGHPGMAAIEVEQVAEAVREVLGQRQ